MTSWLYHDTKAVGRAEWLRHWQQSKPRPELLRVAESFTGHGFDYVTGRQWHPKSLTVIASDAGVSTSSVERFKRRALDAGRLRETGQKVTLVAGKRATPLYCLTIPQEWFGKPFREAIPCLILRDG